ncbi:TetR/AcrR family transcriptional regulator [Photobacterium ganghwense]|uniref:TetR family transcriptional regulator n=1 Tax=Photobacterium ganghwense TaxID=320778 RepID=A0A0J1H1L4_9GAMM|nr:TetR/AcrR family transcriptional regulator [Photobacterium ganghwense]KLV05685.1 TetR family transcriptional regulator [Photobacterium ganghwense]MBV1841863.1 TetR/AcrR family transcriptional regulator [Photobacterium ganghwense]PSU06220.1 TetR family transcriptional regulator [Photobacterium ganghwense]QSV14250.1 TetR/AcrR family transcriptional regulator [Photobacterium ganghwense]
MKTRDRIILAALELFNESGEPNITTNHIAAHLGISPGNLYYHFRNKEEIIHSIFDQYAHDLRIHFQPLDLQQITADNLLAYLDSVFMLMWRYRFFYANLPDILRRDAELQQKYLLAQEGLHQNIMAMMKSFRAGDLLALDDTELGALVNTLKLVVSSWIFYQSAQAPGAEITKSVIYQGVLQILAIVRPLTTDKGRDYVRELEAHYCEQVERNS